MADITKPVILDETGQAINQQLEPLARQQWVTDILKAMEDLDIIWYVENN